jgi:hypothetical protein
VAAGQLGTAAEEAVPVAGRLAGVVQEGEVVHGDDHRRPGPRVGDGRGVDDVDRARGPLDPWSPGGVPRLVEGGAGEGQVADRHGRHPRLRRRRGVPRGDADDVDVVALGEGPHQLQHRPRRPAGHAVPGLFDGDGDAHAPGDATERTTWVSATTRYRRRS